MVAGGHQQPAHPLQNEHGVIAEPLPGLEREQGPEVVMVRSAADFEMPSSAALWRVVRNVRQFAVTSDTRPSSGRLHGQPRSKVHQL